MSSLTLVELDILAGLIAGMISGKPAPSAEQEAARRRAEEMRIAEMERRQEEENRQQLRALEEKRRQYVDDAEKRRDAALREQNRTLDSLRHAASQILAETESTANEFLDDYSNLVFSKDLYSRLIGSKEAVRQAARAILSEARLLHAGDVKDRIEDLTERVSRLRDAWEFLRRDLAAAAENEARNAEQDEQFAEWLNALDAGLDTMREKIEIFPSVPEDDASAHAEAMNTALKTIEYYMYGPDSFYLEPEQKREVGRLYGLPDDGAEFTGFAPWVEAEIESRNLRFAASRRRALDRHIYTMRSDLEEAQTTYTRMCEALDIAPDSIHWDQYGDAQELLSALRAEIRRMTGKVQKRTQRRIVESVIDRALRSARRGMSVSRIGDQETATGSWRGLYQIGEAGTTLEVFADARGNVSIEAGAILENGSSEPNEAQTETIVRNNERFCSSELPLIMDSLREELAAAGQNGTVAVTETQGPQNVHVFRKERYKNAKPGVYVLTEDGTAAAEDAVSADAVSKKAMYLDLEDDV